MLVGADGPPPLRACVERLQRCVDIPVQPGVDRRPALHVPAVRVQDRVGVGVASDQVNNLSAGRGFEARAIESGDHPVRLLLTGLCVTPR